MQLIGKTQIAKKKFNTKLQNSATKQKKNKAQINRECRRRLWNIEQTRSRKTNSEQS